MDRLFSDEGFGEFKQRPRHWRSWVFTGVRQIMLIKLKLGRTKFARCQMRGYSQAFLAVDLRSKGINEQERGGAILFLSKFRHFLYAAGVGRTKTLGLLRAPADEQFNLWLQSL